MGGLLPKKPAEPARRGDDAGRVGEDGEGFDKRLAEGLLAERKTQGTERHQLADVLLADDGAGHVLAMTGEVVDLREHVGSLVAVTEGEIRRRVEPGEVRYEVGACDAAEALGISESAVRKWDA